MTRRSDQSTGAAPAFWGETACIALVLAPWMLAAGFVAMNLNHAGNALDVALLVVCLSGAVVTVSAECRARYAPTATRLLAHALSLAVIIAVGMLASVDAALRGGFDAGDGTRITLSINERVGGVYAKPVNGVRTVVAFAADSSHTGV